MGEITLAPLRVWLSTLLSSAAIRRLRWCAMQDQRRNEEGSTTRKPDGTYPSGFPGSLPTTYHPQIPENMPSLAHYLALLYSAGSLTFLPLPRNKIITKAPQNMRDSKSFCSICIASLLHSILYHIHMLQFIVPTFLLYVASLGIVLYRSSFCVILYHVLMTNQ
jgi:hypothetical protein